MQYLQSNPFSVALGTKKYSENWDRIFGKKDEDKDDKDEPAPDTERAPQPEPPPADAE